MLDKIKAALEKLMTDEVVKPCGCSYRLSHEPLFPPSMPDTEMLDRAYKERPLERYANGTLYRVTFVYRLKCEMCGDEYEARRESGRKWDPGATNDDIDVEASIKTDWRGIRVEPS